MTSRFLQNKFTFAAVALMFALAFTFNAVTGAVAPSCGFVKGPMLVAHGPILPPDPWDTNVTVAHGPILPPDPWDTAA